MTTPPLHGHHHGPPSDELAELEQRDVAVAFVDLAGYSVFTDCLLYTSDAADE